MVNGLQHTRDVHASAVTRRGDDGLNIPSRHPGRLIGEVRTSYRERLGRNRHDHLDMNLTFDRLRTRSAAIHRIAQHSICPQIHCDQENLTYSRDCRSAILVVVCS